MTIRYYVFTQRPTDLFFLENGNINKEDQNLP